MEKITTPLDQIPVLRTIRGKFSQMTQIQQQIARYILDQPARVIKMSISQLTRATEAKSESAIVRFRTKVQGEERTQELLQRIEQRRKGLVEVQRTLESLLQSL